MFNLVIIYIISINSVSLKLFIIIESVILILCYTFKQILLLIKKSMFLQYFLLFM